MKTLSRDAAETLNLVQYFQQCYKQEKYCDLRLQTDDNDSVNCHKFVLCSIFPNLGDLLHDSDHDDVILLPEFHIDKVRELVQKIYENLSPKGIESFINDELVKVLQFNKDIKHFSCKMECGGPSEVNNVTHPDVELSCPTSTLLKQEELDIEDSPFLMDTAIQLLKKHSRTRGKRKMTVGISYDESDVINDLDSPPRKKRGRKPKLQQDRAENVAANTDPSGDDENFDKERLPRKAGIRVSKYELFGASQEEKFPPKFLQSSYNKTALQKTVEEFFCDCEPRGFKSYRAKERHFQLVHNSDKYLECKLCEAVIVKDNFEEHRKICLEKQKANLCPHCGRQFNTASAVSNHVIYVHNLYNCQKCDIAIRGYSKFRRHHLSVHTDPWHCDKCPAVFSEEAKLKDHFQRVHLPDDQKPCVCEICGKGFLYKDKLNTHMMNKHIRSRPYPCRFGCDISYNDRSTRSAHEKKKHGALANYREVVPGAPNQEVSIPNSSTGMHHM